MVWITPAADAKDAVLVDGAAATQPGGGRTDRETAAIT